MKQSQIYEEQLKALEEEDRKLKDSFKKPYQEDPNMRWFDTYYRNGGRENSEKIDELKFCIAREKNREIEVGDGVTICLWSDSHAGTVIKRTKTTLTVQRDKAIRDPNFKPEWIPGGFSAICTNSEEQSYTYERDPKGEIYMCHWSEKHGRFQSGSDGSIRVARGRHEYYDYNF